MKKIIALILTSLAFVATPLLEAQNTYVSPMLSFGKSATPSSRQSADSIMSIVIPKASVYSSAVSSFETEMYIKGRTEILKKNRLIRWANKVFPVDRRTDDMFFEMICESRYESPNNFHHEFKALHGNILPNRQKQQEILTFLNLNVYAPVVYDEGVIMPVARNAHRFYNFNLEEVIDTLGKRLYKIRFLPKQWSQKLICGDIWINEKSWTIEKVDMNGRLEFAEFSMVMSFGSDLRRFILPDRADLKLRYSLLGNVVETHYHTDFNFKQIDWVEEDNEKRSKWKPLDLTHYYTTEVDPDAVSRDDEYWDMKRDIPLEADEEQVLYADRNPQSEDIDTSDWKKFLDVSEQLSNTMSFDYRSARIRYSGILNPLQLGYTARNGITYKQQLRIDKTFSNGQMFRFRPEVGFVFKRKEVFYRFRGEWLYKPEKMGGLSLLIANGNQGYSSEMMKEINEHLKDSIFNFNDLELEYFKHYYVDLKNTIELSNGFLFNSGLSYHRHVPAHKRAVIDPGDEVEDIITETYDDFIPSIGFTYTPRQFYKMEGRRKEYVYSYYPTISMIYARAIPGIGDAAGDYGKVEVDIHQSLPMGLLKKLNYHVSAGTYINPKSTYFADFDFFTRRNFPDTWNDKIGGVFNLLKSEWFNASDKYAQAHLMYESPFILFKHIGKDATKHILSERLYLSHLWTPALPCYTEVGYGIGNHLFNIAVFASFKKAEYDRIGVKFAFEIQ